MNAKRYSILVIMLLLAMASDLYADRPAQLTQQGNKLYRQGQYDQALKQYEQAQPHGSDKSNQSDQTVLSYNRANCFYKLEDYDKAIDLYRDVSAQSGDMPLVARAKYNLGNCLFQQGLKQRAENPKETLKKLSESVKYYRQSLDSNPPDVDAKHNIAVARLLMKEIQDQIKKEEEQKKQQNQDNKQEEQQKDNQQQQNDQQQDQQQQQDEQQQKQKQQQEKSPDEPLEAKPAPDTTADDILNEERERQEQRRVRLRTTQHQPAEKDW